MKVCTILFLFLLSLLSRLLMFWRLYFFSQYFLTLVLFICHHLVSSDQHLRIEVIILRIYYFLFLFYSSRAAG